MTIPTDKELSEQLAKTRDAFNAALKRCAHEGVRVEITLRPVKVVAYPDHEIVETKAYRPL